MRFQAQVHGGYHHNGRPHRAAEEATMSVRSPQDQAVDTPQGLTAQTGAPRGARALLGRLMRWETLLILLLVGVVLFNVQLSPYFWDANNILDDTSTFMEVGIMALPMTLIIVAGQIDLSVASNASKKAITFASLYHGCLNVCVACL